MPTVEGHREWTQRRALACPRFGSRRVPVVLRVEAHLERRAHRGERRSLRQRHQVLPSNMTTSALDAAFVVPLTGPAESRLKRVVRRECREARPQYARRAHEHLAHRGGEIVVGDRRDDSSEVGERCDVSCQKPGCILLRAEHREVAARVHQTHQEKPRLLAHACELHPDLEEVDLRNLARPVHERHGDLSLCASKLRHQAPNGALAGGVPGIAQQLPETGRGQPLLARRERPA